MTQTPQQRAAQTALEKLEEYVHAKAFSFEFWQHVATIRLALTRMGDESMVYVPLSALHTILGATLNEDGAMKVDNVKSWMFRLDFIREQVQPLLPAAPEQKED
jgi:hypothetical protein